MAKSSKYTSRKPDRRGIVRYSADENRIWHELIARQLPMLPGRVCAEFIDALDFMGMLVREVGDGDAEDRLVRTASSDDVLRTRQHAVTVVEDVGLGDQIDRLGSYLLDLEQGESCAARKDAVAKLRALGDKKAIPALEIAQKRIRTEGLLKKKVNANACLRTDAAEAIISLQSL